MTSISASEARAALPAILDRVSAGEEITITRHGQPVAVVLRPDAMRVRRADRALATAERLRDALERGRTAPLDTAPPITAERAEELIDEMRASRAAR